MVAVVVGTGGGHSETTVVATENEQEQERGTSRLGVDLPTSDLDPGELADARAGIEVEAINTNREVLVDYYFYDSSSSEAQRFKDLMYTFYVGRGTGGATVDYEILSTEVVPESVHFQPDKREYMVISTLSITNWDRVREAWIETIARTTDHEVLVLKSVRGEEIWVELDRQNVGCEVVSERRVPGPALSEAPRYDGTN